MTRFRTILAICAALTLLSGCSLLPSPAPSATPAPTRSGGPVAAATRRPTATASVGAAKRGGTLTVGISSLTGFDPSFLDGEGALFVVSNVFSALFRVAEGKLVPDLATDWAFEDERTLVFNLRKGAVFHDDNTVFAKGAGREVVADDVVYSLDRYVTHVGTSAPADLVAAYESVEAAGRYTIKIHLKKPDALLFSRGYGLSAFGVVPKEAIEKLGKDFAARPVGSGPFRVGEYKVGRSLTLLRNDLYWLKPNLDKVVFQAIPEQDAQVKALEAGEIDVLAGNVARSAFERLATDTHVTLHPGGNPAQVQLLFNMKNALFKEQKFRQAVAYGLDGASISREIWGGQYVGGCGTAGPGVRGYDADLCSKTFGYKPDEARRLLGELGWKADKEGRLIKDGKRLTFELEVWSMGVGPEFGAAIVAQLKQVGIAVELEIAEFGEFLGDLADGADRMMLMQGWGGDGGTSGLWGRDGAARPLGYEDPAVDDLIDRMDATNDSQAHGDLVRQAAGLIYGHYWAIPLGFYEVFSASRSDVRDYAGSAWTMDLCTEANNVWLDR